MAPLRVRKTHRPSCQFLPLLNAVIYNINAIFHFISLVGRMMDDSNDDYDGFLGAADKLAETVFWTIAEWRVTSPRQKICWSYPGRSPWFHETVLQYWDDLEWIKNFRMTRQTLFEISETLCSFLMRKDTVVRSAIPVEERVAIGVYFLASRSCYRTIALVFQKGTSTVASIVVEVCLAIEHTMLRKEVRISDFSKLNDMLRYNNTNNVFAVSTALKNSSRSSKLFRRMEDGTLIPGNPMFTYAGVSIPPLILGDGAYPLCKWLMKPYAVPRNDTEKHYNKVFNRTRNIVERAFGRLKARFRRLSVRMEARIENVNSIIASAVVMHNICERKKHAIPEDDSNICINDAQQLRERNDEYNVRAHSERMEAEEVRTAVAEYLYTHVK
ncbi:hypothetical protein JRQ81_014529 [Phrynocephalus forsythii]|uniref:DDE Tnp4 domain-containing protein n=1 Tax=Phrynocephalus forsythii TaxID=171643 RepID=A0A9Q0XWV1_9SAUR|nr:hypothetical protein JRQ81_014529 [Phrynocephalus forsythii]